nr:SPASM domain-containing protein [uncultured Acetobacterium sp.]
MEFINLSRYYDIKNPGIKPFEELRNMTPLKMTQDLKIFNETDNILYAEKLAMEGLAVVPIRRQPPVEKYLGRNSFPRRILFEMTSKCNFLCRMCPQNNLKRERMHIDKDLYKKVLDEIDDHGIEGLWTYHLGESLLHPDFKEIIEYLSLKKNLGIVWMSTNGEFFTEDVSRFIVKTNIDYINFSAHAVTAETYGTVAPKEKFDLVQNNLEVLYRIKEESMVKGKPFIHCQMIEQETTKHEVDLFIKKHYKRADIVSVNMLEYVNLPNNSFGNKQRDRKPLTSCLRVSRNDCFICSNGEVTLCDAAYNGEISLGNINEKSLFEIWNGEERKKILELNQSGRMSEIEFCRNCTDYDI